MKPKLTMIAVSLAVLGAGLFTAAMTRADSAPKPAPGGNDTDISRNAQSMLAEGKKTFRYETFGSEAFWGDVLGLHKAVAGEKNGGVGPGVSPKTALAVGLKVDSDALPDALKKQLAAGQVNLDDPATTVALLKLNAVVGVTAFANADGSVKSMGIQCALCHSTVDDSFAPGIGKRLDGWANRDLNVGAIVSLAPNLKPIGDMLGVDVATVKKVLTSWGPGRYDALLDKDGKAFRPDGKQAGTLIPPAFGLAGINLSTWTGFGSIPYWNAYVAVTQMHGPGTFVDARFSGNKKQYPVALKTNSGNSRSAADKSTSKLPGLQFYQLSIPAPKAPAGSFNVAAFEKGKAVFNEKGKCASCHVPPLFTEPGNGLHAAKEIGVDSFTADRSPTHAYRTAPLGGLWSHQKGGFYHDGRFATLADVVNHYDATMKLKLDAEEKSNLVEYLKGI